nr:ulp1 protease family, C-terminal catalytic domain-containing protein [Tanacetum cinerariifolium]
MEELMDEHMDELMDEHDMVAHNIVEHDMNKQPEPQPQRKKRGIYTLKRRTGNKLMVLCATEMVYPAKQVHGNSVLQRHAKVHVDNVVADYKDYLLLVPTEEFSKIGETMLSFIQWPKKYIELTKEPNFKGDPQNDHLLFVSEDNWFILKLARKCMVLIEDVVRSLSALIYYRDLDTTTLRDLINSDGKLIPEDPQPGVPRVGVPRPPRASMQDLYDRMGRMEIL